MMFGNGFGMGWMWLWGLLALAGIVVLILAIVWAANGGVKRHDASGTFPATPDVGLKPTPRQILDERYAKGELTTEEYRERVTVLSHGG